MKDLTKYHGVIPAFYACYNDDGTVSEERTKAFATYLLKKGSRGFMSAVLQANVFIRARKKAHFKKRYGSRWKKTYRYCARCLQQHSGFDGACRACSKSRS